MALLATEYVPLKPLVAIISEESKQTLTAYLKHQFVPQFNVIPCLDASEFASCLSVPTEESDDVGTMPSQHRKGILRADWLEKHQSRCPAVALVLVPRHHATGDPSSWAALASSLDAIRSLTKATNMRVVLAIVQPPGDTSPLPDDRTAMLARHSGADRSCVVLYEDLSGSSGRDSVASMRSLGVLLQAQAAIFYSTNAQTRLNSYSQDGLASVDANLRAAFKLGALAEMRGDWTGAVQLYKEAYGYVGQVSMAGGAPLQRFLEVRTVAEIVHHRVSTKFYFFSNLLYRSYSNTWGFCPLLSPPATSVASWGSSRRCSSSNATKPSSRSATRSPTHKCASICTIQPCWMGSSTVQYSSRISYFLWYPALILPT